MRQYKEFTEITNLNDWIMQNNVNVISVKRQFDNFTGCNRQKEVIYFVEYETKKEMLNESE